MSLTNPVIDPEINHAPAGARANGSSPRHSALHLAERFGLVGLLLALIILFSVLRPSTFATLQNLQSVLSSQAVIAVAALAVIVPLVGNRFDISVGSVLGLTSIAVAAAMSRYGLPLPIAILIGVGLGAGIGAVNGLIVSRLGVNSLVATIGTSTITTGLITLYTKGIPISSNISTTLTDLSITRIAQVPVLFLIMGVIAVVVWYLLRLTPYGRRLESVGENLTAARLVGIPVQRTILLSFVASGTLAGLAGVLQVAQSGTGNPQVGGVEFLLPALAAAFLGATVIRPGTYNVLGTIIGLYFVGTIVSGLSLLGAQAWVQPVFNGTIVVVAVAISSYIGRRRSGGDAIGD